MELTGEQEFAASRDTVWETVLDAEVLEACIPGAQDVEQVSESVFEGTVQRGLASITVTMDVRVEIVEDNRPDSLVADLEGSDNRVNSAVDGDLTVEIEEAGDGATLTYVADLHFSGKLASLGARLIKRQMNKDLQRFFSNLEEYIQNTA